MLEADFSEEDEDEGEALLQPGDDGAQLGQGGGRRRGVLARLVSAAVAIGGGGGVQQGGAVLGGLVVMVVVVVLGRARQVGGALGSVGALFSGGGRHLDEDLGGRAQHQAGRLEGGGAHVPGRHAHQAGEQLLRGGGVRFQAVKDSAFIQTAL